MYYTKFIVSEDGFDKCIQVPEINVAYIEIIDEENATLILRSGEDFIIHKTKNPDVSFVWDKEE